MFQYGIVLCQVFSRSNIRMMSSTIDQDTGYFEWLSRQVDLKTRPQPYQNVRLRMDRDLAVLLMRTSYNVTDALDFIPMDMFQKNFFLFRSQEWEDYYNAYPAGFVRQGDLADPNYFGEASRFAPFGVHHDQYVGLFYYSTLGGHPDLRWTLFVAASWSARGPILKDFISFAQ
jgi:hypothetical protein